MGGKTFRCQEVLGAVLLSPSNQIYIWGAEDISLESQKTLDVMRTMRAFLQGAEDQNTRIGTIVTDTAKDAIDVVAYFTDKRHSKVSEICVLNNNAYTIPLTALFVQ